MSYDALIVPIPTCYGHITTRCPIFNKVFRLLGHSFESTLQQYILKKYLGEVPLGTSFIMKSPSSCFKHIVVVPTFRVSVSREENDNILSLDGGVYPPEFAYSSIRSALLTIIKFNSTNVTNSIISIFCPDLVSLGVDLLGKLSSQEKKLIVHQITMAIQSIFFVSKHIKTISECLIYNQQIYTQVEEKATNTSKDKESLLEYLEDNKLAGRGFHSSEELETALNWIRQERDPKLRIDAANTIIKSIYFSPDSGDSLPSDDIAKKITESRQRILPILLNLVKNQDVTLHNELSSSELQVLEEIGHGNSSVVSCGVWNELPVAIKVFQEKVSETEFIQELSIISVLRHPNILRCCGGITIQDHMITVFELMDLPLNELLIKYDIEMSIGIRLQMAIDISMAVNWLHSHCNILHQDLKSTKIYIKCDSPTYCGKLTVKLGSIKSMEKKISTSTSNLWCAPEIFQQKKYTDKSDIYSLGIILWELVTRKIPFTELTSFAISTAVIKGDRPVIPNNVDQRIRHLIKECWQGNPKKRPEASKIVETLFKVHASLPDVDKVQKEVDISSIIQVYSPETMDSLVSLTGCSSVSQKSTQSDVDKSKTSKKSGSGSGSNSDGTATAGVGVELSTSRKANDSKRLLNDSGSSRSSLPNRTSSISKYDLKDQYSTPELDEIISQKIRTQTKLHDGSHVNGLTLVEPKSCKVPSLWSKSMSAIEMRFNNLFQSFRLSFDEGTVWIADERYILLRKNCFESSVIDAVKKCFTCSTEDELKNIVHNLLYDMGQLTGRSEANFVNNKLGFESYNPSIKINSMLPSTSYFGLGFSELGEDTMIDLKQPAKSTVNVVFSSNLDLKNFERTKDPTNMSYYCAGFFSGWTNSATSSHFDTHIKEINRDKEAVGDRLKLKSQFCVASSSQFKNNNKSTFLESRLTSTTNWLQLLLQSSVDTTPVAPVKFSRRKLLKLVKKMKPKYSEPNIEKFFNVSMNKEVQRDPVTASVHLGNEDMMLLRTTNISTGFYSMFASNLVEDSLLWEPAYAKFIYHFGVAFGNNSHRWIVPIVNESTDDELVNTQASSEDDDDEDDGQKSDGAKEDPEDDENGKANTASYMSGIDQLNLLPSVLALFGFGRMIYASNIDVETITDKQFTIRCKAISSIESSNWSKLQSTFTRKRDRILSSSCSCHFLSGIIAGWVESCIHRPVICSEVKCTYSGSNHCQFTVSPSESLKLSNSETFSQRMHLYSDLPSFLNQEKKLVSLYQTERNRGGTTISGECSSPDLLSSTSYEMSLTSQESIDAYDPNTPEDYDDEDGDDDDDSSPVLIAETVKIKTNSKSVSSPSKKIKSLKSAIKGGIKKHNIDISTSDSESGSFSRPSSSEMSRKSPSLRERSSNSESFDYHFSESPIRRIVRNSPTTSPARRGGIGSSSSSPYRKSVNFEEDERSMDPFMARLLSGVESTPRARQPSVSPNARKITHSSVEPKVAKRPSVVFHFKDEQHNGDSSGSNSNSNSNSSSNSSDRTLTSKSQPSRLTMIDKPSVKVSSSASPTIVKASMMTAKTTKLELHGSTRSVSPKEHRTPLSSSPSSSSTSPQRDQKPTAKTVKLEIAPSAKTTKILDLKK
eukprot:TRINITY_DN1368_c0_g3_i1.p1 TRINITY_DN1368_c0_g3~~TRINITY_DN1368_c0_g3_i1.p1  ORF type:complete len:1660 (-),score=429.60 TRINITY_DN1368_c0_g3_i1:1455-6278(-)